MTSHAVALVDDGGGDSPSPAVNTESENCCGKEQTKQALWDVSAESWEVRHEVGDCKCMGMCTKLSIFQYNLSGPRCIMYYI